MPLPAQHKSDQITKRIEKHAKHLSPLMGFAHLELHQHVQRLLVSDLQMWSQSLQLAFLLWVLKNL